MTQDGSLTSSLGEVEEGKKGPPLILRTLAQRSRVTILFACHCPERTDYSSTHVVGIRSLTQASSDIPGVLFCMHMDNSMSLYAVSSEKMECFDAV